MEIEIKRLTPALVQDFLYFFDELAFADNPDWQDCYCLFHLFASDEEWLRRNAEMNREEASRLIADGKMTGYLAYHEGTPVGWCHADDVHNLPRIKAGYEGPLPEPGRVGAVVCFVIAHAHRRQGIARALLQHVCDDFKERGFAYVEAYPNKEGKTDAENYHGPTGMYLANGFAINLIGEDCVARRRL